MNLNSCFVLFAPSKLVGEPVTISAAFGLIVDEVSDPFGKNLPTFVSSDTLPVTSSTPSTSFGTILP